VLVVLVATTIGATTGYLAAGTVGMVIWGAAGALGFTIALAKVRSRRPRDPGTPKGQSPTLTNDL
jgi:hypothetical protein